MNALTPVKRADVPLPMWLCNLLDHRERFSDNPMDKYLSLNQWLEKNNIYKLPEPCYQQMYSITQRVGTNTQYRLEEAQQKVRKVMLDWLEEHHPDKELSEFCDLSNREAPAIHPQLQWGMYLLLLPKVKPMKGIWEQMHEKPVQQKSTIEDWFNTPKSHDVTINTGRGGMQAWREGEHNQQEQTNDIKSLPDEHYRNQEGNPGAVRPRSTPLLPWQ